MIEYGIYEIVKNNDGAYQVTERLEGKVKICSSIQEIANYIESDLQSVEDQN